jgi:hypothetical protein
MVQFYLNMFFTGAVSRAIAASRAAPRGRRETRPETSASSARIAELERELEALQARYRELEGMRTPDPLFRWLRAALHPDRLVDPAAKRYLGETFVELTERVKKAGGAGLLSQEELLRQGAAVYAERSARAKRAAATRKANKTAAPSE